MLRKLPYGANYLNFDEMIELRQSLDEKILFRYQTIIDSFATLFEEEAQEKFKVHRALALHNATEALRLSILGTRPKVGDKVYIPNVTFIAVAGAVLSCGLIPIMIDVDENMNMDLSKLPKDAKRVIVPHMEGHVNKLPDWVEYVIEDCAQCMGGKHENGEFVGTQGFSGVFSFHHNKVLTSGEGGLLLTRTEEDWKTMRGYHDHGCKRVQGEYPRWEVDTFYGENFVTSEPIAAIQLQQFRHLDNILDGLERGYHILKSHVDSTENFRVKERCEGDVKLSLRLEFQNPEKRIEFEEILKEMELPFWTLEKYFLPEHPVMKYKKSIYADNFPWNFASTEDRREQDFSETKQRLKRTICLSISPEYDEQTQIREAERFREAIDKL